MKSRHGFLIRMLLGLIAAWSGATARAGAFSDLAAQKDLNPETLLRSFSAFAFELSDRQQDAETFLRRKRGDCDDFASLASALLTERGYKTKLVLVMMEQQTHVVCYVEEARGFLDFNHRSEARPVVASDGSIEDIAEKVASDFRAPWRTASQFKYKGRVPVYLETVFPMAAPQHSARTSASAKQQVSGTNDFASPLPLSSAPAGAAQAGRAGPLPASVSPSAPAP